MAFNLADFANPLVSKSNTTEITMIPISQIRANKFNFYKVEDVTDLAESIKLNGLLAPLDVFAQDDGQYRLFSGHRRFKALRELHEASNFKDWVKIPCIVYEDPKDEAKEELMLIHANSTGRVLSPYETSQQAKRIKALLVQLKEKGVELPGRMRDIVAEEMRISASKLARLEAIGNKLTFPGWSECWKENRIGESVAYEVSQLSKAEQGELWDDFIDDGLTAGQVGLHYIRRWKWCKNSRCSKDGKACATARMRYDRFGADSTGCAGCCAFCLNKKSCSIAKMCPNVKITAEQTSLSDSPRRCGEVMGQRLRELREATGLDRKAFAEKIGEYQATYSSWENGCLPGSDRVCKLAEALNVSIDYLYGRTDEPKLLRADDAAPPEDNAQQSAEYGIYPSWISQYSNPPEGQLIVAYRWIQSDGVETLVSAIGCFVDGKITRLDAPEVGIDLFRYDGWIPAPKVKK